MATVCTRWLTSICGASLSDALYREWLQRSFSYAQHAGPFFGQIDYGARLDPARATVDHEIELVLEPLADFLRIGDRRALAGQQQRGRQHRLAELREQCVRHRVSGDAHADGFVARHPPRDFASRA